MCLEQWIAGKGSRLWVELGLRLWHALVVSDFEMDASATASPGARRDRRGLQPRSLVDRSVVWDLRSWVMAHCCRTA